MYVDPDPECDEERWGEARSMAVTIATVAAFGGGYVMTYGVDQYLTYTELLGPYGVFLQFGVIVGLVVLHEAIHAVVYATIGSLSWSEIEVEVGFDFEDTFDPLDHSVHPARPIRRWAYVVCVAAPGIVLGVVPAALALVTGNALAMFVGLIGLLLIATDVGALVEAWRHPETISVSDPSY
jgi:hypothetical protein